MSPESASANVDPITGWPANGISPPGEKIRRRTSVPACSGGKTNVHSENFVSRVIACMAAASSPFGSRKTAS